jgi:acyl-coenzyme A thioesterase PaaI-like protein
MTKHHPQDPNFESRVCESFARQEVMKTLGASLTLVEPGAVEIELPYRAEFTPA